MLPTLRRVYGRNIQIYLHRWEYLMGNSPEAALGIALLTSLVRQDREAFLIIASELEGGNTQAVAILARLGEAMVAMIAELLQIGNEEALTRIAASLALKAG